MKPFKIIPLTKDYAERIRSEMKDDFGHLLKPVKVTGWALCRLCLTDGNADHHHILFSYMPVAQNKNPYAEVGPVYIHDACEEYTALFTFPPDLKKRKYLTVRGYDAEQLLITGEMSEGHAVEEMIARIFENEKVEYIHINDASSGCYFLKVKRE